MAKSIRERAQDVARFVVTRSARTYLVAGWVLFVLGSYPGYMSTDSILQLYTVRSGDWSDYAPLMSALWTLFEWVVAGPFPMLVLQSGLFLFGTYAILRTLLAPRPAAVTAAGLALFPPVFTTLAVIWPEPLMAASLVAAVGAILQPSTRWRLAGLGFAVLACSCRPEAVVAVFPLALVVLREARWLKRVGIALAVTIAIAGTARLANHALTVVETYRWEHELQMMDVVGTLRRAKVKDDAELKRALTGMPLAYPSSLVERMGAGNDATNWWNLANGDNKIFELLEYDDEAAATSAAWRRAISEHPGAYLSHRWTMIRTMLAIRGKFRPVYAEFGNPDLMAPLHHRAIPSDWQNGVQVIVRGFAKTPLFWPWVYIVLAIAAIVLARRRPLLRALAISGLAFELVMFVLARTPDYRYSHYLVSVVSIALVALAVARRAAWRADG